MLRRQFFVGGNWKCNGTRESITKLVSDLNRARLMEKSVVIVSPPSIYLEFTSRLLKKDILLAAQNCFTEAHGAFTGEISANMLRDMDVHWVILGHSERRDIFQESNELIAKKVAHALSVDINVILCVGEHLEERESNKTEEIIFRQLKAVKDRLEVWRNIVIAYEPVWAIGTGKTATPAIAQETHKAIRGWLEENLSATIAQSTSIIYGGSVKSGNCMELASQEDIDGFLVGGASLNGEEFLTIIGSASAKQ